MNKITFIILNLIFSSNNLMLPIFGLIIWILEEKQYLWEKFVNVNGLSGILFIIGLPIFIFVFFWLFKILLFIVIDKFNKEDSYSYKLFSRIKTDAQFRKKVLRYVFAYEMIFTAIWSIYFYSVQHERFETFSDLFFILLKDFVISFGYWLLFGMGIFISYLSFVCYAKINKKR